MELLIFHEEEEIGTTVLALVNFACESKIHYKAWSVAIKSKNL